MSDNKNADAWLDLEQLESEVSGFHTLISAYLQMINNEGLRKSHADAEIFIDMESRRILDQLSKIRGRIRETV